jgi:hypothetical protein
VRYQFDFGNHDLADPITVKINGRRFRALIGRQDTIAFEKFERELAPDVGKLSTGFRQGLKALYSLAQAGYSGFGAGSAAIEMLVPEKELPKGVEVASKTPMSEAEIETFQPLFVAK